MRGARRNPCSLTKEEDGAEEGEQNGRRAEGWRAEVGLALKASAKKGGGGGGGEKKKNLRQKGKSSGNGKEEANGKFASVPSAFRQ